MTDIFKDDIGTILELTILEDGAVLPIDTATAKTFSIQKPSGAVLTKTAVFSSDGTDGKLKYSTVSGDLDEVGTYTIQANLVMPTGTWSSETGKFVVENIL